MATTYEAIATVTVGSGGAADITFSSIPATYTDLCIKLSGRLDFASARTQLRIKFNTSAADFTSRRLYGEDGGTGSDTSTNYIGIINCDTSTSNTFGSAEIYVPNYASSNYKSFSVDSVIENNSSATYDNWLVAGLWSNTAAITSVALYGNVGSFKQYSTATLYGIKNS